MTAAPCGHRQRPDPPGSAAAPRAPLADLPRPRAEISRAGCRPARKTGWRRRVGSRPSAGVSLRFRGGAGAPTSDAAWVAKGMPHGRRGPVRHPRRRALGSVYLSFTWTATQGFSDALRNRIERPTRNAEAARTVRDGHRKHGPRLGRTANVRRVRWWRARGPARRPARTAGTAPLPGAGPSGGAGCSGADRSRPARCCPGTARGSR